MNKKIGPRKTYSVDDGSPAQLSLGISALSDSASGLMGGIADKEIDKGKCTYIYPSFVAHDNQ